MGKSLKITSKIKKYILQNITLVKKTIGILLAIISIIIIVSCIKGKNNISNGNVFNKGLAMQDGKWIYYIEIDGNEHVGINRVKENGKKVESISEGQVSYLNIVDDYIYCLKYDEHENKNNLIKVKTNGKKEKVVAREIDDAPIFAVDKYIFYYKNNNLYRAKLDGTDKMKISDKDIIQYQIVGNWIYYIYQGEEAGYVARMKLNGTENERIAKLDVEDGFYENIYVKKNKVYYIMSKLNNNYDTNYYLYKMSKKGENIEQICKIDSDIIYLNMQEDEIYYTVSEDYETHNIYKIKYDGTERKKIKKVNFIDSLNITDNWIIFIGQNEDYDEIIRMISIDGEKEKNI